MRPLTAPELLQIWENGLDQSIIERMLHLLSIACSIPDIKVVAQLSIGERDAKLLQLREWLFGTRLINMTHCSKCAERVEWDMNTSDLYLQMPQVSSQSDVFYLEIQPFNIRFRLPNSEDMIRATGNRAYQSNPRQLLLECILEVKTNQGIFNAEELPGEVLETLTQQIEKESPQANITILLNCPACTHEWESVFDIVSYLWTEIDNWAKHLLQEIYILARAFGWSERDIVNMSARRRQLYLEMLRP